MRDHLHLAGPLLLTASLLAAPQTAAACGGTFGDAGPTSASVDQTGESVLFWRDDSGGEPFTEAHIQIQYEGDADRFAWIIPVQAVPEVQVSSQALFENLLRATVPTFFTTDTSRGDCFGGGGFCGGFFGGFFEEGFEEAGEGDPEILDRGVAGAFEYVTLTGDSIEEVLTWLEDAGYAQNDEAPPILQEYLDEGFVFTAVKLRAGFGVDEIHPLALRYPGTEPCIPIRLTRIAAVDDMAIRAFFLDAARVVPSNWPHVELNPLRLDWVNGPETNYDELVSLAVDEAGGRAFVTEYAGPSALVSTSEILDARWNASSYEGADPEQALAVLAQQALVNCTTGVCEYRHPEIRALLQLYVPVPEGVSEHDFYGCVECFADQVDEQAWAAAPGFAADFAARITEPGEHAIEMLAASPYLTRLFTRISPDEMIEDPLFHPAEGLPEVENVLFATRVNDCDADLEYYELPDGRLIAETVTGTLPALGDDPAAVRIEQIPMSGPPQVEVDHTDAIDAALEDYNRSRAVGPQAACTINLGRGGAQGLLSLLAIFGIAYGQRRRSRYAD